MNKQLQNNNSTIRPTANHSEADHCLAEQDQILMRGISARPGFRETNVQDSCTTFVHRDSHTGLLPLSSALLTYPERTSQQSVSAYTTPSALSNLVHTDTSTSSFARSPLLVEGGESSKGLAAAEKYHLPEIVSQKLPDNTQVGNVLRVTPPLLVLTKNISRCDRFYFDWSGSHNT